MLAHGPDPGAPAGQQPAGCGVANYRLTANSGHWVRRACLARENGFVKSSEPGGQRAIVILGSTGSVGTQAIDVVRRNPGRFLVTGLASGGGNPGLLAKQALELGARVVAVDRASAAEDVQLACYAEAQRRGYSRGEFQLPKILAGPSAVAEVAGSPCDVVLNAVTGAAGLASTLAALDAGRTLALANKESLIVGGPLVAKRAAPGQIVPVDSEHSALAQCLRGGRADRFAAAAAMSSRASPRSRRSPIPPGRWARSSPSTAPRW